jgi:hypothetical protein
MWIEGQMLHIVIGGERSGRFSSIMEVRAWPQGRNQHQRDGYPHCSRRQSTFNIGIPG